MLVAPVWPATVQMCSRSDAAPGRLAPSGQHLKGAKSIFNQQSQSRGYTGNLNAQMQIYFTKTLPLQGLLLFDTYF